MIQTSIDEGVESDMSDKDSEGGSTSIKNSAAAGGNVAASAPGLTPYGAYSDLTQTLSNTSDQSISTGTGSPFTSLDSNIEADLMSSLSSCSGGAPASSPTSPAVPRPVTATMTPPVPSKFGHLPHYKPVSTQAGQVGPSPPMPLAVDRTRTHSPVSFREGRRASDGLMAQGVIAFRQRLKEGMKTRGVAELRKEMENLQDQVGDQLPHEHQQQIQNKHIQYKQGLQGDDKNKPPRQQSLDEQSQVERPPLYKRKSLPNPGNLELPPHVLLVMKQSMQIQQNLETGQSGGGSDSSGSLGGGEDCVPSIPAALMAAADSTIPPIPTTSQTTNSLPSGNNNSPLQQQLLHMRLQQKRHKTYCGSNIQQQFQQLQLEPQSQHIPGCGCVNVGAPSSQVDMESTTPLSSCIVPPPCVNNGSYSNNPTPPQSALMCHTDNPLLLQPGGLQPGSLQPVILQQPSIPELSREEEDEVPSRNGDAHTLSDAHSVGDTPVPLCSKQYYPRTCMRPSQCTLHEEASLELEEENNGMDVS